MDCPTGNLVFANVLYDVFDEGDIHQFSTNSEAGRKKQSEHLLSKGAWHVYNGGFGNVYTKDGTILVGFFTEEVEDSNAEYGFKTNPDTPDNHGWTDHGNISGDLRWFYGCDEGTLPAEWKSRLAHQDVELVRVKVAPGRYRLTNHYEHSGPATPIFPTGNANISCVIEKVGRPSAFDSEMLPFIG